MLEEKLASCMSARICFENQWSFKWVKNEKLFKKDEFEYVKNLVNNALEGCKIKWIKVEKIEMGVGGKFKQHICKVKNEYNNKR